MSRFNTSYGSRTATTKSGYYLHDSACSLYTEGHEIAEEFIEVIKEVADRAPVETDYGAAGCGSCFRTDDPTALFWTAQGGDSVDCLILKFDSEDVDGFDRTELGSLIVNVAEEMDVDADWTGDTSDCVVLGDADFYDD